MKTFKYMITDSMGLHARPAGMLVKEAKQYKSRIMISAGDKSAEATKLLALMGMGIKTGTEITVTIEGEDEDICTENMCSFFGKNL